jgi:hypothetical protein
MVTPALHDVRTHRCLDRTLQIELANRPSPSSVAVVRACHAHSLTHHTVHASASFTPISFVSPSIKRHGAMACPCPGSWNLPTYLPNIFIPPPPSSGLLVKLRRLARAERHLQLQALFIFIQYYSTVCCTDGNFFLCKFDYISRKGLTGRQGSIDI